MSDVTKIAYIVLVPRSMFEPPAELSVEERERMDVEARYEASDRLVTDAIDWLTTTLNPPAGVVDAVVDAYRESRAYSTRVDDVLDGEVLL
ncbi:MAG: hypothetical protein WKF58_04870 [Ilumatobacteraceae bacterium]